jgi:hypothetical protein
MLNEFRSCCADFDCIYVVFDALDECEDTQQEHILALVSELLRISSIRIMLTSRTQVQTVPASTNVIDIKAEDADIRISRSSRLQGVRHLTQDLKHEVVEVIARGAEGMLVSRNINRKR